MDMTTTGAMPQPMNANDPVTKVMPSDQCPNCGADVQPDDTECPECGQDLTDESEATLAYQTRKGMKDSDFLYIEPKTGKRMFPIHDAAHIRNALARLPQSKLSPDVKARLLAKLKKLAKKAGIDVSETKAIISGKYLVESEIASVQIITEGYDDGYHRAKFLVTTVDAKNQNGRVYPRSIAEREAAMPMAGDVLGQSGHPEGTPNLLNQFLVWEKLLLEGNSEYAVAKIIPTRDGEDFIKIAEAGARVTCSRRGTGSVKEGVVQNDYKLLGIDVLPPGTQSDLNARMVTFEQKDNDMDELTLESLRAEHADLVVEVEKPLADKVTELTASVEAANKTLTEKETALTERDAHIAELETKNQELTTKAQTLEEQANVLTEQVKAFNVLVDKARDEGGKAAWLILSELRHAKSEQEISESFASVKDRCNLIVEQAVVNVKAVAPQEEVPKPEDLPEKDKYEFSPTLKRIARAGGTV